VAVAASDYKGELENAKEAVAVCINQSLQSFKEIFSGKDSKQHQEELDTCRGISRSFVLLFITPHLMISYECFVVKILGLTVCLDDSMCVLIESSG